MKKNKFYFSTRDLMMMAALAALGGIASTYINMIGDFFQSLFGFAGTTQWAAGLHIIWLMLASVLVGKPGAASLAGVFKGFVELFSGNTHGILVVMVDIVAGLVIDLVLLLSKKRKPNLLFYLAAGLSSASNVIVFQVFASLPSDILAFIAIAATSALAFGSGILFGGVMTKSLVNALDKIGVIRSKQMEIDPRKRIWAIAAIILAGAITFVSGYSIYSNQTKVNSIVVGGEVANPINYPNEEIAFDIVDVNIESNGATRQYSGTLLKDIVNAVEPVDRGGVVLIEANDGYSFFVSMDEILENENLLITSQESGNESVYNVVGAVSTKAWVRGVTRIYVLPKDTIDITGKAVEPFTFAPQDWQDKMDSIYFSIDDNQEKLQGVPLAELVDAAQPFDCAYMVIVEGNKISVNIESDELIDNKDIRLFTFPRESGFEFILGEMDGTILVRHVREIEIK